MMKDLQQKKITRAELHDTTEEALAKQYDASRDTVRKARNKVLPEFVDNLNSGK